MSVQAGFLNAHRSYSNTLERMWNVGAQLLFSWAVVIMVGYVTASRKQLCIFNNSVYYCNGSTSTKYLATVKERGEIQLLKTHICHCFLPYQCTCMMLICWARIFPSHQRENFCLSEITQKRLIYITLGGFWQGPECLNSYGRWWETKAKAGDMNSLQLSHSQSTFSPEGENS